MDKKKKKWSRPKLIILIREKPEERVLTTCKQLAGGNSSGNGINCCYSSPCSQCMSFGS
jgi:hypothetical protein